MQIDLLKEIVTSVVGQSGNNIVDLLYGKKNVNEFIIAKKLNVTINQARNVLYKLADEGLVSFVRKKDRKKGGWYTYFWTLNTGKGLYKFKEVLDKEIDNLSNQYSARKTKRFYHCPNCDIEYNEETALLNNYSCPECGEVLNLRDLAVEVKNLEKSISKLKEVLVKVNEEIGVIEKQGEKTKQRKLKLEKKKKQAEREERRKKKQKEMKKLGKLIKKVKKAIKKKAKKGKKR